MMDTAWLWSQRSLCSRAAVGAVVAVDGRAVATGYNGPPAGSKPCTCNSEAPCTETVHAELNAILFAAKRGVATDGATLYTTVAPCLGCSGAIVNSGIIRVVYAQVYRSLDGVRKLQELGVKVDYGT